MRDTSKAKALSERSQSLTLEARHTISLEISKKRRLKVAKGIFLPRTSTAQIPSTKLELLSSLKVPSSSVTTTQPSSAVRAHVNILIQDTAQKKINRSEPSTTNQLTHCLPTQSTSISTATARSQISPPLQISFSPPIYTGKVHFFPPPRFYSPVRSTMFHPLNTNNPHIEEHPRAKEPIHLVEQVPSQPPCNSNHFQYFPPATRPQVPCQHHICPYPVSHEDPMLALIQLRSLYERMHSSYVYEPAIHTNAPEFRPIGNGWMPPQNQNTYPIQPHYQPIYPNYSQMAPYMHPPVRIFRPHIVTSSRPHSPQCINYNPVTSISTRFGNQIQPGSL